MYDKLHRFQFGRNLRENTGDEPSGQPATVLGKPVDGPTERKGGKGEKRYEDVATDVLTKIGADEAKSKGYKEGSAKYFEFVREFVRGKMERMKEGDMEPGEPATDPNSPDATTTNKELGERRNERKGGKKGEGDEPPPFIQAKIDAKKKDGEDEDGEDPPDPDDPEGEDEPEDEKKVKEKTEAMIDAVVQGKDPHKIVESLFRR